MANTGVGAFAHRASADCQQPQQKPALPREWQKKPLSETVLLHVHSPAGFAVIKGKDDFHGWKKREGFSRLGQKGGAINGQKRDEIPFVPVPKTRKKGQLHMEKTAVGCLKQRKNSAKSNSLRCGKRTGPIESRER
jgi:hypothetical protein